MSDPARQSFARFLLVLGMLIGMSAAPTALADSEDTAATKAASNPTPEAVPPPQTGPQVYKAVCIACHAAPGLGGAPPLGDAEAWAARIAKGRDTLIENALGGFSGSTGIMPRKGGRLDLSDEEVIEAVEFMIEQVSQ